MSIEKNPQTPEKLPNKETSLEKLRSALRKVSAELRTAGLPVHDDARVDMKSFIGLYDESSVNMNILAAERLSGVFEDKAQRNLMGANPRMPFRDSQTGTYEGEKIKRSGEQLEALKTVVFHKFLKEHFLTSRTSMHDDVKNGIDNLIIDRNTGNLVGAFDEVADSEEGARFHEKQDKVLSRNLEGGGNIKYGFSISEGGRIVKSKTQSNIPVFYLALSEIELERGMAEITPGLEKSDAEKALFNKFFTSIETQIEALRKLKAGGEKLNDNLVARLESFAKKLAEVKDSIFSS